MSKTSAVIASAALRVAQALTTVIILLAAVASAGGLLLPGLYRDTPWVIPQNRGQDLVTLLLLPALAFTLLAVKRRPARATLVWIGLLGYVFYVYTGAAFAYVMNKCFLIYVALFSLSIFALVTLASGIQPDEIQRSFDIAAPRKPVAVFLVAMAFLLTALWLGQIIPFLTQGILPESITLSGSPTMFVYVLDLGIVVPVALLAAVWLWRRSPWGYILAGCILIKAAAMGLALLSMTWFGMRAGLPVETGLVAAWVVIAAGGFGMSVWFFRHCRG